MRVREKISGAARRIRGAALWRRLWESRLLRLCRRGWALCNENPFPWQVLLVLIYRLALDAVYLVAVSPVYAYEGFTTDLTPLPYLLSWMALLAFAPFAARLTEDLRPSSILMTLLNAVYFIPLTSYYGCHGTEFTFFAVAIAYWALFLFFQFRIPSPVLAPLAAHHTELLAKLITAGCVLLVFYISGRYTGFRLTLDFINVYGIRVEARSYNIPGVLSYLLSWMPVLMALLLLWWLKRKKYGVVALMVVTYLFLFSISAQKSTFFFLLLVLAGWFLYRSWMLRWHTALLTALAGVCTAAKMAGFILPTSLAFRRMMYLPVKISQQRFELFQDAPLSLFRDSIMGKFSFDALYSASLPRLTGEFRGNLQESANNGLLGDLFANLPLFPGLLLMPLLLVLCFRLLDLSAGRTSQRITVLICVYFTVAFSNGSWSTVLLSGGFLLTCIVLYFFHNDKEATNL